MEKVKRKVLENPFGKKEGFSNPGVTLSQSKKRIIAKLEKRGLVTFLR
ncbi:hypothetical protein [uncultured Photobacterium sp.]|nr:hypothetical protein [uncultured Photobacterium sp.]